MSKLYFRYGAMNCGKSTNLLQVAYNYEERGMKVIIIKPKTDTKGANRVVSRLGVTRAAVLARTLAGKFLQKWRMDCLLVDEAQFLKKEQVDQLFEIAVNMDIPVICYGLRTDFLMNGFEGSERLLLIAHSIEELKTICSCGKKALVNGRKINGEFVFDGDQVAIDKENDVEYQSLCPKCYFEYKKRYEEKKKIRKQD